MSEKQPSEVTTDALRFAVGVMELPLDVQKKYCGSVSFVLSTLMMRFSCAGLRS